MSSGWLMVVWVLLLNAGAAGGADFAGLCAERTAVERVYYQHRLGTKPPFEEVSPPSLIARLVKEDLRKEAVLRKVYGVTITPAQLTAEVERINTTTRAPETLAEIKAALGNDAEKFANALAKPILVERTLRSRFDNDDALHLQQRRECEQVREKLLSAKTNGATPGELLSQLKSGHSNKVSELTWLLTPHPVETNAPAADEAEIRKRFGPEARVLSSPQPAREQKLYFEDLPADLQRVLRVQLRNPGDVSAVIETSGGFLLYVERERSDSLLKVAMFSLPKRNYEEWLEEEGRTTERDGR